jgi:hypothetical protein
VCVRERECVCESVFVCVREGERVRERVRVYASACERWGGRENERVGVTLTTIICMTW